MKPRRAMSIASDKHASRPRRPHLSASATQPPTEPGTVTDLGPVRLTRSIGDAATGSGAGCIEAEQLAVPPDERERVSANARRHRLGHGEDRRSGESGIGGVAAAREHSYACECRQRLAGRHHAAVRSHRRPLGREVPIHPRAPEPRPCGTSTTSGRPRLCLTDAEMLSPKLLCQRPGGREPTRTTLRVLDDPFEHREARSASDHLWMDDQHHEPFGIPTDEIVDLIPPDFLQLTRIRERCGNSGPEWLISK